MIQKAVSLVGTLFCAPLIKLSIYIKVDVDVRLEMRKNIVISGEYLSVESCVFDVYALLGPTTLFPGLKERLQDGITSVLNTEAKVVAPPGDKEPRMDPPIQPLYARSGLPVRVLKCIWSPHQGERPLWLLCLYQLFPVCVIFLFLSFVNTLQEAGFIRCGLYAMNMMILALESYIANAEAQTQSMFMSPLK